MFGGVAEHNARIEAVLRGRTAARDERVWAGRQIGVNLGDDIDVPRVELHRLGRALHVHDTDAGPCRPRHVQHPRIALQPGDVVDDLGPEIDGPLGHSRLRRVDRHRNAALGGQPSHDLSHPP